MSEWNYIDALINNIKKAEGIALQEDNGILYSWSNVRNALLYLQEHSENVDGPVAIHMHPSVFSIVTTLFCFIRKTVFVPINPDSSNETKSLIIQSSNCKTIIFSNDSWDPGIGLNLNTIIIDYENFYSVDHFPEKNLNVLLNHRNIEYDTCCVVFTSGTTGGSKGIKLGYTGIINYFNWKQSQLLKLDKTDKVFHKTPLSFDVYLWEALLPLATNSIILVPTSSQINKNINLLVEHLLDKSVTVINLVPFVLDKICDFLILNKLKPTKFKMMLVGGEVLQVSSIQKFRKAFGEAEMINLYGPAEASISVSYFNCRTNFHGKVVPIGKPLDNVEIILISKDIKTGVGEIVIKSDQVALGYLNESKNNAFCQTEDGKRCYSTGDLGFYDKNDNLVCIERIDSQLKVNGIRIDKTAIENLLKLKYEFEEIYLVQDKIGNSTKLRMYIYSKKYLKLNIYNVLESKKLKIKDFLNSRLVNNVPFEIFFLKEVPLNANGKVDKRSFNMHTIDRVVNSSKESLGNVLIKKIKSFISSELNIQINEEDNLINYGIDSLTMLHLAYKINKKFSLNLNPISIFEKPIISHWVATNKINQIKKYNIDEADFTPQLNQIRFNEQIYTSANAYNCQYLLDLQGSIPVNQVIPAIEKLFLNESIFAINFVDTDVKTKLIRKKEVGNPPIIVINFSTEKLDTVFNFAKEISKQIKFDTSQGECIKWILFTIGENCRYILVVEHHYVHDGWSIGLFTKKINHLLTHNHFIKHEFDYLDWSENLKEIVASKEYKQNLSDYAKIIKPFYLRSLKANNQYSENFSKGQLTSFCLTRSLYQDCKYIAKKINCSLFSFLLTAFQIAAYEIIYKRDFLIATAYSNRLQEFRDTVGMFVNSVVLPVNIGHGKSYVELIQNTEKLKKSFAKFQNISLTDLIKSVGVKDKNLKDNTLFNLMFGYHDSSIPPISFNGCRSRIFPIHLDVVKNDINVVCIPRMEQLRGTSIILEEEKYFEILWEYSNRLGTEKSEQVLERFLLLIDEWTQKGGLDRSYDSLFGIQPHKKIAYTSGNAVLFNKSLKELLEETLNKKNNDFIIKEIKGNSININGLRDKSKAFLTIIEDLGIASGDILLVKAVKKIDFIAFFITCLLKKVTIASIEPNISDYKLKDYYRTINAVGCVDFENGCINFTKNINFTIDKNVEREISYIYFTSGTTGEPKAICGTSENLDQSILSRLHEFKEKPKILLSILPFHFDVGITTALWSIISGKELHICEASTLEGNSLTSYIIDNNISHINVTPSIYKMILSSEKKLVDSNLERVMIGGEKLKYSDLENHFEILPNTILTNEYGPTECSTYITRKDFQYEQLVDLKAQREKVISIGKPIVNTGISIFKENQLCKINEVGEVCISGPSITIGYYGKDFDFITYDNKKWYCTGDLGYINDNEEIVILGRKDNQIKVSGYRVEPEEIEDFINSNNDVVKSIVRLEGHNLTAYIQHKNLTIGSLESIRRSLVLNLERSKVPAQFRFVKEIHLTKNGKVDRNQEFEVLNFSVRKHSNSTILSLLNSLSFNSLDDNLSLTENGLDSIDILRIWSAIQKNNIEGINFGNLYSKIPIKDLSNIVSQSREEETKSIKVDQWMQNKIGNKNFEKLFQYRVFKINSKYKKKIYEEAIAFFENRNNFLLSDLGENIFLNTSIKHLKTRYNSRSTIQEKLLKLNLNIRTENGYSRYIALCENGLTTHLAVGAHHVFVDYLSWEIFTDNITRAIS